MTSDYAGLRFWMDVVQMVGIGALGIYTWWSNREKVTAKRFTALEKEMTKRVTEDAIVNMEAARKENCSLHLARTASLELTMTRIDSEQKNSPGRTDINELHARVTSVVSRAENLAGRLEGIVHNVELINEHLMERGNKG
uniref:Uncharacterized protein n=1 Tax=viral metagenome TaxID=1070528 RepID=A0A6H2A4T7_9ZZZZ